MSVLAGDGDESLRDLGKALAEIAHRDAGELVYAEARKQALIRLEDADHFVPAAVQPHLLADRIDVGKQRIGNGASDDDHAARMVLIELRDEAPFGDGEKRKGLDVLRFDAAQEKTLDVRIAIANFVDLIVEVDPVGRRWSHKPRRDRFLR